ncbi:MAG: CPBP family intramembrane metalloprotease [Candidatus Omnitrophica bacterium]|nr:CPBP family intramembrane metalloprotease [Candidatus Omnitrophota bacterium]MDE2222616.1 CPBP family intramembrane metalloprotease [Candidatus Omnitrophota bacterium]
MNKRFEWFLLVLLAISGVFVWCRLALPRYQSIDLSVSQSQALKIAKQFLETNYRVKVSGYTSAALFSADDSTDRYLQRIIGTAGEQKLVARLHYDMFCWVFRFFKEAQKEEYKVAVSSATGQVIGFNHAIEDTAARPPLDKDKARQIALRFLKTAFGFNPDDYSTHSEDVHKFDNRTDYAFSWERKDVQIPWHKGRQEGSAKVLTSVTVSGGEILNFNKYAFNIPEAFNRYVDNLKQTGQNLSLVFRILYLALMTLAIVAVVNRKHQVVSRAVRPFYTGVGVAIFIVMAMELLNNLQGILFGYPTTQSLGDYVIRQLIEGIIAPFFVAVGFVLPALAGESLRFEVSADKKNRGFLNTLLSSFFSVNTTRQIMAGYCAAAVILGVQSFIFSIGYKYWGVWDELSWMTQATTTFVPALSALAIGFQASFSEESMFRLFAINFLKKYKVPTALAVFLSAAVWGFGHTGYEIFPMWFRGVEVTSIGLLMGFFYLRYGLLTVITAHFFIDAFLSSLPFLVKPQLSFNFGSALLVIGIPLILGLAAWIFDKKTQERPLSIRFNPQQQFTYDLLMDLCRHKTPQELAVLKRNLLHHGWDAAIVQRVFEDTHST